MYGVFKLAIRERDDHNGELDTVLLLVDILVKEKRAK